MIKNDQMFEKYMEDNFKSRLLKDYRDIPEVKERILQDSLNGTVPDTPGEHSIDHAIIELERQIQNNAWKEQVKIADIAMKNDTAKPSGLFGLFKGKESANNANQAENISSNRRK